jgi:hypothetical protein
MLAIKRTVVHLSFRTCHSPQSQYWRGSSADGRLSWHCAQDRENGIIYSAPDFRADFSFLRLVGFDLEETNGNFGAILATGLG